jgi:hypothetical protein
MIRRRALALLLATVVIGGGGRALAQQAAAADEIVTQPELVTTSTVMLAPADARKAAPRIAAMARALGGQLVQGGDRNVVVDVPNASYSELVRRLREVGSLRSERVQTEDMTDEIASAAAAERAVRQSTERLERAGLTARDMNERLALERELEAGHKRRLPRWPGCACCGSHEHDARLIQLVEVSEVERRSRNRPYRSSGCTSSICRGCSIRRSIPAASRQASRADRPELRARCSTGASARGSVRARSGAARRNVQDGRRRGQLSRAG